MGKNIMRTGENVSETWAHLFLHYWKHVEIDSFIWIFSISIRTEDVETLKRMFWLQIGSFCSFTLAL